MTTWTYDTLRRLHRDPASSEVAATQLGAMAGGLFATRHFQLGSVFSAEDLPEEQAAELADYPPVDARLAHLIPIWRGRYILWIIRSAFGRRYGPVAQKNFDSILDELRCLVVGEDGETVVSQDPEEGPEASFGWWFETLDEALAEQRQRFGHVMPEIFLRCQAFTMSTLVMDPASPMLLDIQHPMRDTWAEQVSLHVGWVEPTALQVERMFVKDLLRALIGDGAEIKEG